MKRNHKAGKGWAKGLLLALFACIIGIIIFPYIGGRVEANAELSAKKHAAASPPCTVEYYTVNAEVNEDRTITFKEEISFTMLQSKNSFYRALPMEGDRFLNITAEGVNNPDFSFDVQDNPDVDGFIDINCYGGLSKGKTLTYRFTYTMECHFSNTEKGMIIDFVGGGWPFALNNVDVKVSFPAELAAYQIHSTKFGESGNDYVEVVEETSTYLHLHADKLPLSYSDYGNFAVPVTVQFDLVDGGLQPKLALDFTRPTVWVPIVLGLLLLSGAFVLFFFSRNKPVLSTVVGFKPPEGKDPMTVGYQLDGNVDNEDITSMIYYFASKGYLSISFEEGEAVLHRKCELDLPDTESAHAKALFEGLFDDGRTTTCVSDLKNAFYVHADKAKILVGSKKREMYQRSSLVRFVLCALLAMGAFLLIPALVGLIYVGGGYVSFLGGMMMLLPVGVSAVLSMVLENYRYKWDTKRKVGIWLIIALAMVIGGVFYVAAYTHVLTLAERLITLLGGYGVLILGSGTLVRTEEHTELLGRILGFKEFILVTKKERLEELIEQNPALFYDVLPYAQVLGVSDVWEEKFKSITIQPPTWYEGDFTLFDYWIIRRSMRLAAFTMMTRPSGNGSSVGGSGGGGSFGGFSGGGGGGGGGGFR